MLQSKIIMKIGKQQFTSEQPTNQPNIKIHGKRASADYESARKCKEELSKIIGGGCTADQVYNADQTGLYLLEENA